MIEMGKLGDKKHITSAQLVSRHETAKSRTEDVDLFFVCFRNEDGDDFRSARARPAASAAAAASVAGLSAEDRSAVLMDVQLHAKGSGHRYELVTNDLMRE
jgi:hypothetical protein